MMKYLLPTAVALLLFGCSGSERKYDKAYIDLDSLISRQVLLLREQKPTLEKIAKVGAQHDTATVVPDSLGWAHELEVFRQLDAINKPTFRDGYQRIVSQDTQSNLQVLWLKSTRPSSVPSLKLFYRDDPTRLRKLEAEFRESNALFVSTRWLQITFDETKEGSVLNGYKISGEQKMMLSDTVQFSIEARVHPQE